MNEFGDVKGREGDISATADSTSRPRFTGIEVDMEISAERVLETRFIQKYFDLETPAQAIALAVSMSSLLINEMKRGSIILTKDRAGQRSRLILERRQNETTK
jgi:hypothetical protein